VLSPCRAAEPTVVTAIICGLILMIAAPLKAQNSEISLPGIYMMNADGSNFRLAVKLKGKWNGTPSFSPDGKTLLFDASEKGDFPLGHIYVMPPDGSAADVQKLGIGNAPGWSPDGKRIAFYVHPGNPDEADPGIWMMNSDGTGRTWLTTGRCPRWGRDGTRLLFIGNLDGTGEGLYIMDLDKKEELEVVLERTHRLIAGAAWSPDGKRVAYIRGAGQGITELVIQPLEGNDRAERVRYKRPPALRGKSPIGWRPGWSPDGKYIVCWISNATGQEQLHRIEADTDREPELLAHQDAGRRNSDANWSPDSKQIVFMSDR
jgi:Tol biopolymer transport system component